MNKKVYKSQKIVQWSETKELLDYIFITIKLWYSLLYFIVKIHFKCIKNWPPKIGSFLLAPYSSKLAIFVVLQDGFCNAGKSCFLSRLYFSILLSFRSMFAMLCWFSCLEGIGLDWFLCSSNLYCIFCYDRTFNYKMWIIKYHDPGEILLREIAISRWCKRQL
jgi:hypothetical protein